MVGQYRAVSPVEVDSSCFLSCVLTLRRHMRPNNCSTDSSCFPSCVLTLRRHMRPNNCSTDSSCFLSCVLTLRRHTRPNNCSIESSRSYTMTAPSLEIRYLLTYTRCLNKRLASGRSGPERGGTGYRRS